STLPGSKFPPAPGWAEINAAARKAFPGVPVGGGMFSYFTELNRKRPPADLLTELRALRDLGVAHVILETQMRDVAQMSATYERFAAEVRAVL
ncbi:MAG: hypothetical protein EHM88_24080, partial [Candidatus Rokuibacteriota bacterium]